MSLRLWKTTLCVSFIFWNLLLFWNFHFHRQVWCVFYSTKFRLVALFHVFHFSLSFRLIGGILFLPAHWPAPKLRWSEVQSKSLSRSFLADTKQTCINVSHGLDSTLDWSQTQCTFTSQAKASQGSRLKDNCSVSKNQYCDSFWIPMPFPASSWYLQLSTTHLLLSLPLITKDTKGQNLYKAPVRMIAKILNQTMNGHIFHISCLFVVVYYEIHQEMHWSSYQQVKEVSEHPWHL